MPLSRKAAVLVLLFADFNGVLRVVLTIRSNTLNSHAGQAAFPGGKAEEGETAFETARREASEEIGLDWRDVMSSPPLQIEHLCEMPTYLAATEHVVRPCVAFLHSGESTRTCSQRADSAHLPLPWFESAEVAAVFSAPLKAFLYSDHLPADADLPGKRTDWYRGKWYQVHEAPYRMHHFFVPASPRSVINPRESPRQLHLEVNKRYDVFGMTARILTDVARCAYDQDPNFEHNVHFGDETVIRRLRNAGKLGPMRQENAESTNMLPKNGIKL